MPNPKHRVQWSPESENDLLDIWQWGTENISLDAADNHLRNIKKTADNLADWPHSGRSRDELLQGIRSSVIYPTVLFYRIKDEVVEIVRVVDGRRNIAALFSELRA